MKSLLCKLAMISVVLLAAAAGAHAATATGPTEQQQKRHLELFHKGQALWPVYCNHCHNARNPAEFAPYQWDQIIMHMRTMENLPREDQDAILEYLKTAR